MADNDNEEANEDVLAALEDLEEGVADLKEAVDDHPDQGIKATLSAEVAKFEEIFRNMRTAVGQR
jgi:hypothetical protein